MRVQAKTTRIVQRAGQGYQWQVCKGRQKRALTLDDCDVVDIAQLDINKTEAAHRSIFVAGWRPFIGWSCGVALAWNYIAQPILVFTLAQTGNLVDLPALDMSQMMPVLMGMLGLGGLRTFEKYKSVSK